MSNVHGSHWIRPEKRLALYIRDGFACVYCGRDLRDAAPAEVTLDHITPRVAGGSNAASNLVTACRSCNSARQDTPVADFAPEAVARIAALVATSLNMPLARAIITGQAGDLPAA